MMPTVLVGFAEAMSAPEVVWSLVNRGYKVSAFARKGRRSPLRFSRSVTCHEVTPPDVDANAALRELDALCEQRLREAPLVLFPLDDSAVWLSCRIRARPGLVLAGPSLKQAGIALDKNAQIAAARIAGFNVPKTKLCTSVAELREKDGSFPFILKPANAVRESGGRLYKGRFWICGNSEEMEAAVSEWAGKNPLLVQPLIRGTGEGLFGLATNEGVRAWSAHRRLRMMNPHGSGSSACVSQPVSDDLTSTAERFIRDTGWRGLFMIEFLRDRGGKVWFVEFNGRAWGSMALSRRQELEYPVWNVELALAPRSQVDVKRRTGNNVVCKHLGREFMHLLFVLRGPKSVALPDWPSFWKTLYDVIRIRRSDGIYNWWKNDPKVLIADFFYTVHDNVFKPKRKN
jgi:hypothetical protein